MNSFIGCTGERLIAVYFNNRGECIGKTVVSEGTVNSTDIPVRKIAETGYRMKNLMKCTFISVKLCMVKVEK